MVSRSRVRGVASREVWPQREAVVRVASARGCGKFSRSMRSIARSSRDAFQYIMLCILAVPLSPRNSSHTGVTRHSLRTEAPTAHTDIHAMTKLSKELYEQRGEDARGTRTQCAKRSEQQYVARASAGMCPQCAIARSERSGSCLCGLMCPLKRPMGRARAREACREPAQRARNDA